MTPHLEPEGVTGASHVVSTFSVKCAEIRAMVSLIVAAYGDYPDVLTEHLVNYIRRRSYRA